MSTTELEDTFLTMICKNVIDICKESDYFISKLTDTLKDNTVIIGTKPLTNKGITKDYGLSVHHHCEEKVINNTEENDDQGIELIEGKIYLDFYRKVNSKDANIFDAIDKYAHTGLLVLRKADPSFNCGIFWKWAGKRLWVPEDASLDNPSLSMICEMCIKVYYGNNYTQIYSL